MTIEQKKELLRAIQPAGVVPSLAVDPTQGLPLPVSGIAGSRVAGSSHLSDRTSRRGCEDSSAAVISQAALECLRLNTLYQGHSFSTYYGQNPSSTRVTVSQSTDFLKELQTYKPLLSRRGSSAGWWQRFFTHAAMSGRRSHSSQWQHAGSCASCQQSLGNCLGYCLNSARSHHWGWYHQAEASRPPQEGNHLPGWVKASSVSLPGSAAGSS